MMIKYLFGLGALLFVAGICAAFGFADQNGFELAKQEVMLRKIGHELLLHAGDSTSRVLPVKHIAENEYQIRFEREFAFEPDTLAKIVGQVFKDGKMAQDYVVNVVDCVNKEVVFGYSIVQQEGDHGLPCSGRVQPKACYLIQVKFEDALLSNMQKGYLIGGIPLLACIGLVISSAVNPRKRVDNSGNGVLEPLTIGHTLFEPNKRQLTNAGTVTLLTAKENKLLLIFADAPNVIIERQRLQKEIWEDEGVIVGRSLDMFISKLRKKLTLDPTIQLVNIHGKGYRLEISN